MSTNKPQRLLSRAQVIEKTSLSQATIYLRIKENNFPAPVPLGTNRVAWLESEIDDWISRQLDKRQRMTDPARRKAVFF